MISYDLKTYRDCLSFSCNDKDGHYDKNKQINIINNTYLNGMDLNGRISQYNELYFSEEMLGTTIIISYDINDLVIIGDGKFLPIVKLKFKTYNIDYSKCDCNNSYRNHKNDMMLSENINDFMENKINCGGFYCDDNNDTLEKLLYSMLYPDFNNIEDDNNIEDHVREILLLYIENINLFIKA